MSDGVARFTQGSWRNQKLAGGSDRATGSMVRTFFHFLRDDGWQIRMLA